METKVTKDGFVWLIVGRNTAKAIYEKGEHELYVLYNGDAESLIEDENALDRALSSELPIAMEVGFIKDLLPKCPMCDTVLTPSRNTGYDWECLVCDSDFLASEI